MAYINVREVSKLIESSESLQDLDQALANFQQKYSCKLLFEEYETLLDLALKINKREKNKGRDSKKKATPSSEIFTYGEFKLFAWTVLLHCSLRRTDITGLV